MIVHPQLHPLRKVQKGSAERDVWSALRRLGFAVEVSGLQNDPRELERELSRLKPYAVFNLLEEFRDEAVFDFLMAGYLEARGIPFTGCNPRGLVLSRNKYLVGRVAGASGIQVPQAGLVGWSKYQGPFPAFVKFNREHASRGIELGNRVSGVRALNSAVKRMRRKFGGEVLVQQFIEGHDVTVSVMGNGRLEAFAPWKLHRKSAGDFSTEKVKFSSQFRHARGIRAGRYRGAAENMMKKWAKIIYRELDMSGYARMDFRVGLDGQATLIDVNPNPNLERGEDFACSAAQAGIDYLALIDNIVKLAVGYSPRF